MDVSQSVFFDVYSVFLHHHHFEMAVTSLYVALAKREAMVCSSPRELKNNLVEQRKLLALIITTLSGIPEEERVIEDEGEVVSESELKEKLMIVEGQLTLLAEDEWGEDAECVVKKLAGRGNAHLAVALAAQWKLSWDRIAVILAGQYEECRNSTHFCQSCKWVLSQDRSGNSCCAFLDRVLTHCPTTGAPFFVIELVVEGMERNRYWSEGVLRVLMAHGRVVEACDLVERVVTVACKINRAWVPLKEIEGLLGVVRSAEGDGRLSAIAKRQLGGWRKKLETVTLDYMKARICEELRVCLRPLEKPFVRKQPNGIEKTGNHYITCLQHNPSSNALSHANPPSKARSPSRDRQSGRGSALSSREGSPA